MFLLRCVFWHPSDKAIEDAGERVKNLQDILVSLGYAKDDLKTVSLDVDTEYESVKDKNNSYKDVFVEYSCKYGLKFEFNVDKNPPFKPSLTTKKSRCIKNIGFNKEVERRGIEPLASTMPL